jgi:subtilisin family serine protease
VTPLRSLAVALLVLAISPAMHAQDVVSTRCREVEVALDSTHTASRLDRCGDPSSPDLLWHLDRIDQLDGVLDGQYHRRGAGAGAVIYVMDTGILASHAEFTKGDGTTRVIAGFDVTKSVNVGASRCASANKALRPCYEDMGELIGSEHGTSVASIAAGANIGVAPAASVVSIRVMNESALATTRTYLEGLNAIIKHAWDPSTPEFQTAVVNISGWVLERLLGNPDPQPVPYSTVAQRMRDMINGVDAQGRPDPNGKRFFFVVAGNNVDNGCGRAGVVDRFPATMGRSTDGMITVGGMTADNNWWSGACRGGVEILAPSHGIFSASISANDHYRGSRPNFRSGTSFGTPIISGIAALLLSQNPFLTPQELETIIVSTHSRIFNPDPAYAGGKVAMVEQAPAPTLTARVTHAPQVTLAP